MSLQSFTVYDMLARNAQAYGERTALVTETGEHIDYRSMLGRVDQLASGLAAAGLSAGDRLVVLAQNSTAYFELYFAAARQGVVLYPLNWRWSGEEAAGSLERADARGIGIDAQYHETLPEHLPGGYVLIAQFDDVPAAGWTGMADLYQGTPPERPAVAGDDPFAIISTAAVDGVPRGAVLTHTNVLTSSLMTIGAMGLGVDDGNLLFLPLFHVAALSGSLAVVHAGGKNVLMTGFDPVAAVELIDEHAVTFIGDFPPILPTVLHPAFGRGNRCPFLDRVRANRDERFRHHPARPCRLGGRRQGRSGVPGETCRRLR